MCTSALVHQPSVHYSLLIFLFASSLSRPVISPLTLFRVFLRPAPFALPPGTTLIDSEYGLSNFGGVGFAVGYRLHRRVALEAALTWMGGRLYADSVDGSVPSDPRQSDKDARSSRIGVRASATTGKSSSTNATADTTETGHR